MRLRGSVLCLLALTLGRSLPAWAVDRGDLLAALKGNHNFTFTDVHDQEHRLSGDDFRGAVAKGGEWDLGDGLRAKGILITWGKSPLVEAVALHVPDGTRLPVDAILQHVVDVAARPNGSLDTGLLGHLTDGDERVKGVTLRPHPNILRFGGEQIHLGGMSQPAEAAVARRRPAAQPLRPDEAALLRLFGIAPVLDPQGAIPNPDAELRATKFTYTFYDADRHTQKPRRGRRAR